MRRRQSTKYRPVPAHSSGWMWVFIVFMALLMLFVAWISIKTTWGAFTMAYELTETELIIRYGPDTTRIPRSEITRASLLTPTGASRVHGTSMSGLKEGRWSFRETGTIYLYCSDLSPVTVIETESGKKWGISPAEPEVFEELLSEGGTGRFLPPSRPNVWGVVLLGVVGLGLPLGTVWLLVYLGRVGPKTTYTLTPDSLQIHMGFSRIDVPYQQIQSVEIANPKGSAWKSVGAAMPGLYWGRFGWRAAGPNLRLYATRLKPLVLVRTRKTTYGITPVEDEAFVAALQERLER